MIGKVMCRFRRDGAAAAADDDDDDKGKSLILSDRNLDNGVFLGVTFRITREFVCRRQSSMFGHRSCSAEIGVVVLLSPRGARCMGAWVMRVLAARRCDGPCDQVLVPEVGVEEHSPGEDSGTIVIPRSMPASTSPLACRLHRRSGE
jgi:hypothetical protein